MGSTISCSFCLFFSHLSRSLSHTHTHAWVQACMHRYACSECTMRRSRWASIALLKGPFTSKLRCFHNNVTVCVYVNSGVEWFFMQWNCSTFDVADFTLSGEGSLRKFGIKGRILKPPIFVSDNWGIICFCEKHRQVVKGIIFLESRFGRAQFCRCRLLERAFVSQARDRISLILCF